MENSYTVKVMKFLHLINNCTIEMDFDGSETDYFDGNFNNCTYNISLHDLHIPKEVLYEVPSHVIILLSMFYGTISVVAVIGNSLVIWIVSTSRRMQNVTNYYIANLALADIVIGVFAIPFQFQAALLQRWPLPEFMCPFCPFVQVLSVSVSIFTLTAIAIDRHRAILNPLRAHTSKCRAKGFIALIWLIGIVTATPMAIALRVIQVSYIDSDGIVRTKPFCYNTGLPDELMLTYRGIILLLQYILPLIIISRVYARMAFRLWGSHAPGNAQCIRDANLMKNKKKVIKMLVIVVAIFAICWFPLQMYMVLQDILPQINEYKYINIIFFCCDWLAMSNSCYNPFIYGIYNEKFKREFRLRFRLNKKNRRRKSEVGITPLPCRSSVRTASTNLTNNNNWHNQSFALNRNSTINSYNSLMHMNSNNNENNVPARAKQSNKELYVFHNDKNTTVGYLSDTEFDELCL